MSIIQQICSKKYARKMSVRIKNNSIVKSVTIHVTNYFCINNIVLQKNTKMGNAQKCSKICSSL